jgi:hypothetical protein
LGSSEYTLVTTVVEEYFDFGAYERITRAAIILAQKIYEIKHTD